MTTPFLRSWTPLSIDRAVIEPPGARAPADFPSAPAPGGHLEAEALRRVYADHGPAVRRFLWGLLREGARADDALQETFARALGQAAPPAEEIGRWLFGIARNVAREHARGAQRLQLGPHGCAGQTERASTAESPERAAEERETLDRVRAAIGAMREERRAALLLRVQQGLSYEDIAAALGCSVAKAKVEVHRARVALRAGIAADEAEKDR